MNYKLQGIINQLNRLSNVISGSNDVIVKKRGLVFGSKSEKLWESINTLHTEDTGLFSNLLNQQVSSIENFSCLSSLDSNFSGQSNLKTAKLENVISVGDNLFQNCTSLSTVELDNIQKAGDNAFYGCTQLTGIYAPNIESLGANAFNGCKNLIEVNLPKLSSLGSGALANTSSIISINLPSLSSETSQCVTQYVSINNDITALILPQLKSYSNILKSNSIICIDFSSLTYLNRLQTPNLKYLNCDNVTSLGYQAFNGLTSIEELNFPKLTYTGCGYHTFEHMTNLKSVNAPKLQTISDNTFMNNLALTSINAPELTGIGGYGFIACGLLSAQFPKLKFMGLNALAANRNMKYISIPNMENFSNRSYGGTTASWLCQFQSCTSLSVVDFSDRISDTIPTAAKSADNIFAGCPSTYKILVPERLLEAWKTATNWTSVASHIVSSLN